MSTRILENRRGNRRVSTFHGAGPDAKPALALTRDRNTRTCFIPEKSDHHSIVVDSINRGRANLDDRLLSYGTEPERRRLTDTTTGELLTLALAVIRDALPARPFHDGKQRRLLWNLKADQFEVGVLTLALSSSMTGAAVNGMANGVVALEKDRNVKRNQILRSRNNRLDGSLARRRRRAGAGCERLRARRILRQGRSGAPATEPLGRQGRAEALGLAWPVDPDTFQRILEGKIPDGELPLRRSQ